jgi:hypothetical protein
MPWFVSLIRWTTSLRNERGLRPIWFLFQLPSSTMIRHEWNRLDYWVKADGRSLRADLDRCPVTGSGLAYLTPGGGEITARDH